MYRLVLLLSLFLFAGCLNSTGSLHGDVYNMGQARLCAHIAALATDLAWPHQQDGRPVEDVIAAVDDYAARHPSLSQQSARQINRAIYVVYANPQWSYAQAHTGVEQDCRRTSMY